MKTFEKKLRQSASQHLDGKPAVTQGHVGWESPSNIAIVKYWGKYPGQVPANASLSMTLRESVTRTMIDFDFSEKRKKPGVDFEFHGAAHQGFARRIEKYLTGLSGFMPWISHTKFTIRSENTFPHSSGIASSASAMSALAACLCEIDEQMFGKDPAIEFEQKASFFARLGSGSAARSIYGRMAEWGITASCGDSSDEYAIPLPELHPDFFGLKDSILIITTGEKEVSSSLGHDLMRSNPYAKLRFEAAEENMQRLCNVMRNGDLGQFIDIMENEALSLHAMMMTSSPGYLLMKPGTLEAISRIRKFRAQTGLAIGFTLDAGANVHIIYPGQQEAAITNFIASDLEELCEEKTIIHDGMGMGPRKL